MYVALALFGFYAYLLVKARKGWVASGRESPKVRGPLRAFLIGGLVGSLFLPLAGLLLVGAIGGSIFLKMTAAVIALGGSLLLGAGWWGRNHPRVRQWQERFAVSGWGKFD